MRVCKKCSQEKHIDNFGITHNRSGRSYRRHTCLDCARKAARESRAKNLVRANENTKRFFAENPTYRTEWKDKNRNHIRQYIREYEARPHIRLRKRVSRAIKRALEAKGSRKKSSILSILPYSMDELKSHLESQFEPWMNWGNWGVYDPNSWDDADPGTWTWQIDHIDPMANFSYSCETDPGFLEAWAMKNLRPLKSKVNVIDGACKRRIHKAA